jgi:hypothetical protein
MLLQPQIFLGKQEDPKMLPGQQAAVIGKSSGLIFQNVEKSNGFL